jgi:multiple sugar transport system substrate-binding protein
MIEGGTGFMLFTDDFSKTRYDEPRGIEWVAWLKSLVDNGLAVKGAESMVDDDAWELLAQQKIGVLPANLWCNSWIKERVAAGELKGFEIRFVQYPHIEGAKPKAPINSVCFSVFDKGDELKAKYAKEWIKFLVDSETEATCNILQNAFSAQISRSDMYANDPENNWVATVLAKYGYDPGFSVPTYQDTRMLMFPELQAVFAGMKTPERAMRDFTARANALITK